MQRFTIAPRLLMHSAILSLQLLVLLLACCINVLAQATTNTDGNTPLALTPGAPAGSYPLSDLDNINLFNGNLNFRLPLLNVGGRGDARMQMELPIEQHWRVESYYYEWGAYYIYYPNYNWWTGLKTGYGPGVVHGRTTVLATSTHCDPEGGSIITAARIVTRLTFTGPDGTEYELRDQSTGGRPLDNSACVAQGPSRGTVFITADGSAATFVSDTTIYDNVFSIGEAYSTFYPTGYLMLRNGVRYRVQNGLVTWMRDRNGNKLTFAYDGNNRVTTITDSVNRQITVAYDVQDGAPYGLCDRIQFKGYGGATRTLRVSKTSLGNVLRSGFTLKTYYQLFPEFNGSCSTCTHNPTVTSAVWLPDGRSYSFLYNSYGELSRAKLPTGGSYEYDYAAGLSNGAASGAMDESIYRRVIEKRSYTDDGVLAAKSTFSRPETVPVPPTYAPQTLGYVDVDELDLSGNRVARARHYFYGAASDQAEASDDGYPRWQSGREYKLEQMAADGSTVLRRTIQSWQQRAAVSWWSAWCGSYCLSHPELEPPNDTRLYEAQSELTDVSPAQISKQVFGYDGTVPYNNQNNIKEYDYGSGSPGSLARETRTTFVTSSTYTGTSVHLRSLPTQSSLYDAGGIERARVTYEYDNYTNDSTHAPLVGRTSISGLDSGFTTSYTTRGNATAVTRYLLNSSGTVTGSVTNYSQSDVAGNVVKTIDGRGNATTYDFDDRYGTPDGDARLNAGSTELNGAGQASYAFATKRTAGGFSVYTQFDYYLARPVDVEDENGTTYSGYYNDPLDRPSQMIGAVNRDTSIKTQTTFTYDDTNRNVTSSRDLNAYGDNLIKTKSYYDGLGRTVETRKYEGSTNYIATQNQFDPLGRVFKVSNPFRPWASETAVWTTTAYDALNRTTAVTTPDNAVATTSYSGASTTATDQYGKKRKSVIDALGREVQVYEDPTGVNYLSSYTYNVLDNLVTVTQGTQTRTYGYDSLRQLVSATNPESGTVTYTYDNNGNLLTRTDARSITATVAYDVLNRPTSQTYQNDPNGTASVNYYYDGQSLPGGAPSFSRGYSSGRLVAVTYGGGSSGDYFGYDAVGKSVLKIQQTGGVNYQVSATYNNGGLMISETYPSGHAVTYSYDQAGRTSGFTGTLGDGTQRNYATGISYTPRGSLSQEEFGTDTAIYNKLFYTVRGQLAEIREGTTPNDTGWNRGAIINHYSFQCWGMCSGVNMPDNNNTLKKQEIYIPDNDQISSYKSWYQQYSYDGLNRLTIVNELTGTPAQDWLQIYTLDRWGNRTIDVNSSSPVVPRPQFTVDTGSNRLAPPSGYTMTYDASGNLTFDNYSGAGQRTYDAENRMKQAWANGQWQTYTYDGTGQRVRRNVNGTETWQVYGFGGALLAEYGASVGASTPKKEFGYRNGQLLVQASAPQTSGAGLMGQYFDTMSFGSLMVTRTDATVDFDWGGGSPDSSIGVDTFTVRWTGQVKPLYSQTYTFYTQSDDGVRLWVNGQLVIDNWTDHAPTENSGQITLTAGQWYDVKMEFYENGGGAMAKLLWSSASQAKVAIPSSQLSNTLAANNLEWVVTDHLGNTRMVLDKTGSLAGVKRHDFLPYGEELGIGQGPRTTTLGYSMPDGIRQQFTRQERDNETGLDFFQARYYASSQGRFTSPDPLLASGRAHHPQSWNRYTYALNNPVQFVDPTGERACLAGGCSGDPDNLDRTPPPQPPTPPPPPPPPPPAPAQQPAPPQQTQPVATQSATLQNVPMCGNPIPTTVIADQMNNPAFGVANVQGTNTLTVGVLMRFTFLDQQGRPVDGVVTEVVDDSAGQRIIQSDEPTPLNANGEGGDLIANTTGSVPQNAAQEQAALNKLNSDFTTKQTLTLTVTTSTGVVVRVTQERTLTNTVRGAPSLARGAIKGYTFTMEKPKIEVLKY